MPRRDLSLALLAAALPAVATAEQAAPPPPGREPIPVPSGQSVVLIEVFLEPQPDSPELWARFRFLAPAVAGGIGFRAAARDMAHLCTSFALPLLAARELRPDLIVISLSSRPTAFGETAPDATQFFEMFRPDGARCLREPS